MSKRLLTFTLALGLLAAACSRPPVATLSFGAGKRFVPEVADFLDNVGVDPSVAVTSDGTPYVAYFGFVESLAAGEVAPTRPIGAPSIPSVLLASLTDGFWTRGAVAMAAPIANVNIPFGPATDKAVADLSAANVTGTGMAVDGQGKLHVVWATSDGVWYATNAGGSFAATQVVSGASGVRGPSIAVDASGLTWIAYYAGGAVDVASMNPNGKGWATQTVATVKPYTGLLPIRTGIGVEPHSAYVVVAFSDGGDTPMVATGRTGPKGRRVATWTVKAIRQGDGGLGLSLALDKDNNPHVAYYSKGEIHEAESIGGAPWQVNKVASFTSGGAGGSAGWTTGIGVDDKGIASVTWYDPGADEVRLAANANGTFAPIATSDTQGGDSPSIAVTPDGSTAYLAWYDHIQQNLEFGTYGAVTGLAIANPSPIPTGGAPSPSPSPTPAAACEPIGTKLQITAQGIAFDTTCLAAPADTPFTITFNNKDTGIPHNVAIYTDSSATTNLFRGDIATGPTTATYNVPALKAGTYFFRCDIHPTQMFGTFIVK